LVGFAWVGFWFFEVSVRSSSQFTLPFLYRVKKVLMVSKVG